MSEFIPITDRIDADERMQSCELQWRSYGQQQRFSGRIRTVICHEDNVLVKQCLASPGEGSVLVVDGGGSLRCGLVGDLIGADAVRNGWAGIVINGAARDVAQWAELDIGLKALGSNPRKSGKTGAGMIDVPVVFGGVVFRPGDMLYSDEDGIIVGEG